MRLDREDLRKFKKLRLIVKVGTEIDSIDVQAASDMGKLALEHFANVKNRQCASRALIGQLTAFFRPTGASDWLMTSFLIAPY